MSYLEAAVLGVVQGLTEFLPISSSAHLRIVGEVLPSAADPGATFTAVTQIGTEAAVLVYFRTDIARIATAWTRSILRSRGRPPETSGADLQGSTVADDARTGWLIVIGSLPIAVAGYLLQDLVRNTFRSLWLIATVLIVFGLLLAVADRAGRRTLELDRLTYRDGLLFGLAQTLALVPGVSRSGATTTTGLALGYTRPAAARYAFLLAMPAVFGSGLYELRAAVSCQSAADTCVSVYGLGETLVATAVAFGVGLAVIAALMNYISRRSFTPFVVYRMGLGVILFVLLSAGVVTA